jgi:hypothetical protein
VRNDNDANVSKETPSTRRTTTRLPATEANAIASGELHALLEYMELRKTQANGVGPMLRIPGKLGTIACELMLETGANKSYGDRSFVHRHGFSVTSKPEPVTLANGETVFTEG